VEEYLESDDGDQHYPNSFQRSNQSSSSVFIVSKQKIKIFWKILYHINIKLNLSLEDLPYLSLDYLVNHK